MRQLLPLLVVCRAGAATNVDALPRGWSLDLDPGQPRPGPGYFGSGESQMAPDDDLDCSMRFLAYEYALSVQPQLAPLLEVFDALELETKCKKSPPQSKPRPPPAFRTPADAIFVDYKSGRDSNNGTKSSPFKTLKKAVDHAVGAAGNKTIVLRAGVHYLASTLQLGAIHSGLTVQNYGGEQVWLSGGVVLDGLHWLSHNTTEGANIWKAVLPDELAGRLSVGSDGDPECLGLNSAAPLHRQTRARWPNRVPGAGTVERGWARGGAQVVWKKDLPWPAPSHTVTLEYPNSAATHADGDGGDAHAGDGICGSYWTYGVGGKACDRYSPKGGYLCSNVSSGGGFGWEKMVPGSPMFPVGVSFPEKLMEEAGVPPPSTWRGPHPGRGAVVQRWTNGWCTTMFEVDSLRIRTKTTAKINPFTTLAASEGAGEGESESASGSGNGTAAAEGVERVAEMTFGRGGQQTGRGFHPSDGTNKTTPIESANWRIENAYELLDQPEEYFFDAPSRTLYLWHNTTRYGAQSPEKVSWVVPSLKRLVEVAGTQGAPAVGVTLRGLGFRDAAYTYMDDWGVPSGGDWALHRGGALFIEGAKDVTVHQCRFEALDGNAAFLSGFTRGVEVSNSSFAFVGDNAIAAWGDTRPLPNQTAAARVLLAGHRGVGIDGTGGDQPRDSLILGNVMREIGFNERQSSAFGQFKSCGHVVRGNLMFNMPRAAINANDGFGGGTIVEQNVIFNTCRESGDHGPFNSWDRQPFLTDVPPGASVSSPSLLPDYIEIRRNLIVANYGAGFAVDNDDTSSYYRIHGNVFYMGGGVKCDYDGHEKYFYDNVMVAMGGAGCWHTCAYKKGYTDHCYNNTMVQARPPKGRPVAPYAIIWFCNKTDPSKIMPDYGNEMLPVIHSNTIYNVNATATVTCGYSGAAAKTTVPLSLFTERGLMPNTKVLPLPSNEVTVAMGRKKLGLL